MHFELGYVRVFFKRDMEGRPINQPLVLLSTPRELSRDEHREVTTADSINRFNAIIMEMDVLYSLGGDHFMAFSLIEGEEDGVMLYHLTVGDATQIRTVQALYAGHKDDDREYSRVNLNVEVEVGTNHPQPLLSSFKVD